MAKPRLGILNSSSIIKSYGGIAPFIKNLDPFLCEAFEVSYIVLPDSLYNLKFIPHRLWYLLYLLTKRKSLKKMDFIISHVPEGSYIASFGKIPFVHIFHGNTNPMSASRYWYGKYFANIFDSMEKRIIKKATLMYTVGAERPGIPKIINPVFHSVKIKPAVERKGFIFAGRLEKMKNIDKIIRVYAKLPAYIQEENPFYVAGIGTQEESLKRLAASLPIQGKVIFLGNLSNEDLIEVDSSKRILLMASTYEGFPMAIAEAFSLGVPVISTDVGDISRFVKHNENGILVPVDFCDEEYISSIETILSDYDRFSRNAIIASNPFNAEKVAAALAKDINKIMVN